MLFRLAYLSVVNVFAVLRLPPGSDRDKDAEILALRHQLAVMQRRLGGQKIRFQPADRALLAALLQHQPRPRLRELTLLVRPDTILRRHSCGDPRLPLEALWGAVNRTSVGGWISSSPSSDKPPGTG